ncbi:MAG: MFS transporter [Alphaproteobacteria bacterium]|nr:MFS transporter [Alphaproteobacteria bacterium]
MREILKKYIDPKILPFLGLGIAVQAPINLIGGSLKLWTRSSGLELATVGVFAAVTMPYSLKFLWAPIIDRLNLPWAKKMGCKRAWCLLFQLGILAGLWFISFLNPLQNVWPLFIGCLLIAVCGASQALTVDSLKIDILNDSELTDGTAVKEFGGRIGYLGATAGMLALSHYLGWNAAYKISTIMTVIGIISLMFVKEPISKPEPINFNTAIKMPFMDLWNRQSFPMLCLFIVLYKLCNGMLGSMAWPFYHDNGFSDLDIMRVSSIFGTIMTAMGIFCGGIVLHRFKFKPLLFTLGCIEILTSFAFAGLAMAGRNIPLFVLVIIFDNIVGGIGSAVWVVFISRKCSRAFSATQYGFLDALTMIPLTLLGMLSGWLAQTLGWIEFFMLTGLMMVPALILIQTTSLIKEK